LADLDVSWSVVGRLQTNKAKDVAAFADEFQALDSLRVAQALDRRLQAAGRSLDVYVQVNTSGEESKYGLAPASGVAAQPVRAAAVGQRVALEPPGYGARQSSVAAGDCGDVEVCRRERLKSHGPLVHGGPQVGKGVAVADVNDRQVFDALGHEGAEATDSS